MSLFNLLYNDFNDLFSDSPKKVETKDGEQTVTLNVPGFNERNLNIELDNDLLTIKGETETRKYFKQYYTSYGIEDIDAKIKDGVLTLTLKYPKRDVKRIEVKPSQPQIEHKAD
jgi:HSP20 family molecular chaperone IbpA